MAITVLLVDDDEDDRTIFSDALEAVAPEIICNTVRNGRSALSKLDKQEMQIPDLIILDINMPLMSGWQCLSALKEHRIFKSIPVIMYSTSSHQSDIDKANNLGALCFFTKPADFRELKQSLAILAEQVQNKTLSSIMLVSPLFVVPSNYEGRNL
jgi:CheY-like chemotaxis protein